MLKIFEILIQNKRHLRHEQFHENTVLKILMPKQ